MALEPDEIRAIRERLGLSQVEAGELIGGGPRAFTKYEAGTIRPRASVVRLLRVLEANPDALSSLTGRDPPSASISDVLPLEVSAEHIPQLTERTFPALLRRLLSAEAQAHGLPVHGIHVAGSITTPDGGEDGRITWTEGPPHTLILPSRFCQFQVKAGKVGPASAAREVVGRNGEVKPMVRSALEAGGHYLLLCAHPYPYQQIEARENRMREAIRGAGVDIHDVQAKFCDADWVASWVNRHPSVAAWVKERTKGGTVDPLRSWFHWASRAEHDSSRLAEDDRLGVLREPVRGGASGPRRVVRVVGASGIGKSRLILEALGRATETKGSDSHSPISCSTRTSPRWGISPFIVSSSRLQRTVSARSWSSIGVLRSPIASSSEWCSAGRVPSRSSPSTTRSLPISGTGRSSS